MDTNNIKQLAVEAAALLIVDMQVSGCERHGPGVKPVIRSIQGLLSRFRQERGRVIHIQSVRSIDHPEFAVFGSEYSLLENTPTVEFIDELKPLAHEEVVLKRSHDCFYKTSLEAVLERLELRPCRDTIIITGIGANNCVYHAVLGFHVRNYFIVVPADCIHASRPDGYTFAINQFCSSAYNFNVTVTQSGNIVLNSEKSRSVLPQTPARITDNDVDTPAAELKLPVLAGVTDEPERDASGGLNCGPAKMAPKRYGSDLIVDVIKQYDFDYVSINPGSSFRALHDSLVHYGGNKKPEIIECLHENTAVGIAHGYARATGKPMLTILHNLVGLLHGAMAIYYAFTDRIPMVIAGATGPMDIAKRRPHMDWIHTALIQGNAIRDYVKWDDQPYSIASVPDSFARAYRIANTEPKGPTYICFDIAIQEEPLGEEVPLLNVKRLMPPTPIQADQHALERAADLLVEAEYPVALAGYLGRNEAAVDNLIELSELLSLPVMDLANRFNFPNTHPLDLTGSDCLESADIVLALDVRGLAAPTTSYSAEGPLKPSLSERIKGKSSILPSHCRIIEMGFSDLGISSWAMEYGKLHEVDLSILCDTSAALPELIKKCRDKLAGHGARRGELERRFQRLSGQHDEIRKRWQGEAQKGWALKPMTVPRLAAEVWEVIKKEDWLVTASSGLKGWARKLWDFDKSCRFPGECLGTGTHINISLGVALACRGTGKLVVDFQADGDLLFDTSALWVATHHHIPMLVVMLNNRAYQNSWKHAISLAKVRGNPVDKANVGTEIDRPAPDFAKIAQGFGWYAEGPIEDGDRVQEAIERAIRVIKREGRPALIDTVVQR